MVTGNNIREMSKALLEKGIKPSHQRLAILGYLRTHLSHPTVDTIFQDLSQEMPTLSRTTVYNTVKILSDAGLVRQLAIDPTNQRFDGNTESHHHFLCRKCGEVFDLSIAKDIMAEASGLKVERTEVFCYGLCPDCSRCTDTKPIEN